MNTAQPQEPIALAIKAGLQRAEALRSHKGLPAYTTAFWDGYAKGLRDLSDGTLAILAAKDARTSKNIEAGTQGAWSGLPVGAEVLPSGHVMELNATQSMQLTADAITDGYINSAEKLKNSVFPTVICSQDKHSAHGMNVSDVPDHVSASPSDASELNIAQEGGAA